jgi:hypothetical protein
MTINRVGPVSCAKIAGVIYAALGLLIGALFSLFALLGMAFSGTHRGPAQNAVSPLIGAVVGFGAIVAFPILYGVMGFVGALLGAWLYNLIASWVGGIEIDIT